MIVLWTYDGNNADMLLELQKMDSSPDEQVGRSGRSWVVKLGVGWGMYAELNNNHLEGVELIY